MTTIESKNQSLARLQFVGGAMRREAVSMVSVNGLVLVKLVNGKVWCNYLSGSRQRQRFPLGRFNPFLLASALFRLGMITASDRDEYLDEVRKRKQLDDEHSDVLELKCMIRKHGIRGMQSLVNKAKKLGGSKS